MAHTAHTHFTRIFRNNSPARHGTCECSCSLASRPPPPLLTHHIAFAYHLRPDKYSDEVTFLNHVLDFFIIDQADFWCSKILPWAKTDSLHFQWNVWSKPIPCVLNPYVYDYRIPSYLCIPVVYPLHRVRPHHRGHRVSVWVSSLGFVLVLLRTRGPWLTSSLPLPFQTPSRCASPRDVEPLQPFQLADSPRLGLYDR